MFFLILQHIPHVWMGHAGKKNPGGWRELGWSTAPGKQGHYHHQAGSLTAISEDCDLQTKPWKLMIAGCHWSQCNVIQLLWLVPGKWMMKFQLSLSFIYSLYFRRICCIYKGGGQMIKSYRLFPSLRLLLHLSTYKTETWFRSPKYLVCHIPFSSEWT